MKRYRIPELAHKYTHYPMIQTHTSLPELAHYRLQLIQVLLCEYSDHEQQADIFALATALVQLGMDTHDHIDVRNEPCSESEMRTRQIRVLSGDYFSARFYQILANANQISLITDLSRAVSKVNQLKIDHYLSMRTCKLSADEYFAQAVRIRSGLFEIYDRFINNAAADALPELLYAVTSCELLLDELARAQSQHRFKQSWAYWHVLNQNTDMQRQLLHDNAELVWSNELAVQYNTVPMLHMQLDHCVAQLRSAALPLAPSEGLERLIINIEQAAVSAKQRCNELALNET